MGNRLVVTVSALAAICLALLGSPAAVAHAATTDVLQADQVLHSNESLTSANGALSLIMQGDGNLVLYAPGSSARWQSHTDGNPGAWAILQGDGNFVVYSASNVPLWYTHTEGSGTNRAVLQSDGNFVLYTADNRATWQSGTFYYPPRIDSPGTLSAGQKLQSPNGVYTLYMQGDGNLVLYGAAGAMWQSGTAGSGANRLSVQPDGNAVLYTAANNWVWQSYTSGKGSVFLQVQDDGNVVLYAASGWVWQTYTYPGSGSTTTKAQVAIRYAQQQIGKPYAWGGVGPNSFDCSGLTMQAWAAAGVAIPRVAADQYNALPKVPYAQRQPGDLIFYGSPAYHVAIYIGGGQMIEAPQDGIPVRQISVYQGYQPYVARPA